MKTTFKNDINPLTFAGGAFAEKFCEAMNQIAENIQNPNTDAAAKRQINIVVKFTPSKSRQMVHTTIQVTTKLAATEAIDTQILMGVDLRTGELEIAEYDGQIRGQMSISDLPETRKPIDLRNRTKEPEFDPETGEILENSKVVTMKQEAKHG